MKELDNRKFAEKLRMMAGQDASGNSEVLLEACRRIEALQFERDALTEELCKNKGVQGSGRVWVLPCELDGLLYMIVSKRHSTYNTEFSFVKPAYLTENNFFRVMRDFGTTVFLTKEEADAKLIEIRQKQDYRERKL